MTRVSQAIRDAVERLSATSDTARLDAELLMAHALGVSRSDLLLSHMDRDAPVEFENFVKRRAAHEPVAYIVGEQEFFGLPFSVSSDVLIPRPDSEVAVQAALEAVPDLKRVLDLGTGSGALLLAILESHQSAEGVGVDASEGALAIAHKNARFLGDEGRAMFLHRDWREDGWAEALGKFDLVIANPPYVEENADLDPSVRDFEPTEALFAGPDGLDDYKLLIPQLDSLLLPNGVAVFEIGYRQADTVAAISEENGYESTLKHDLAGRPRALILRKGVGKGRITG